ncbi:MAG TPA: hypothetical protein DEH25_07890 [Chloroflexi bacterium]|nr:hypothetical protein [Chloroflexota bacterium]
MAKHQTHLTTARLRLEREWHIWNLTHQIKANARLKTDSHPVVMFDASTRLSGFSQNAAFALLTTWSLQLAGVPVIHFACRAGMSRCVLGTDPDHPWKAPPCEACTTQAKKLYASAETQWFEYQPNPELASALKGLSFDELSKFEFPFGDRGQSSTVCGQSSIPLGVLALPSLRWALRRHHLSNDKATRFLLREYIQSAYQVVVDFAALLTEVDPRAVVLFNGLQFPEAAARWVARQFGVPAITHEVGFQSFSVFFTHGEATAYPIEIPEEFELSPGQFGRVEAQYQRRLQGDFTMAGITFWPQMNELDEDFLQFSGRFQQIVPVFTNVIFDTSQVHANTIFPQMFAWLDLVLEIMRAHPETLFVIRAHPDEMRAGKQSRESVRQWVADNGVEQLPNVKFVPSDAPLSSYELIRRSKFVMVYNSSIGLEATLLGAPVLCGGKARYTRYPTVFLPSNSEDYRSMAEQFLAAENIEIPAKFTRNAWRFMYYQFYRAALPLDRYLEAHPTPGYVQLKRFGWRDLLPENSPTLNVIVEGILNGEQFLMPEESGK